LALDERIIEFIGEIIIVRSRTLKIGFGIVVTVACLVVALWGIDLNEIRASFQRANYASLPVIFAFLFLFYWLKAVRWKILLCPLREFQTREVAGPMMIGFMGNNVLPVRLGELARVLVLGREFNLSKTAVLSSVVLERVFDTATILVYFGGSLLLVELPASYAITSLYLGGLTAIAFLFFAIYVFWTERFVAVAEWILDRLRILPATFRASLSGMLESGAEGLASLRDAKLVFWIVITSAMQWFLMGAMVYAALWSFGVHLPLRASFVVMGVVAFGVAVPSVPGFFGVIQLCFWVSLSFFGAEKVDVLGASVYFHLAQYIPVTLVGLYYLGRLGLRVGDITTEAESESEYRATKVSPGASKATHI